MGLMNRMRDKTHIILIVLVLAFLGTIIFQWGMDLLGLKGQQYVELGSVNGEEISHAEFDRIVQQTIEQQKQQTGEDPDETVVQMIREQVWNQMVEQLLAQQQCKKLGIKVTDAEITNWVYNSPQTLPDDIKRYFIDSTGQFNMAVYQQALASKNPDVAKFWTQVEDQLRRTLLFQKLTSVLTASVRVPQSDVLQKYKDDNIYAAFDYAFLDAQSVQDNAVQVTDEDLKNYYEKHKDDFRTDEMAKLKYILFSDNPTAEDSTITEKQLRALTKEMKRYNEKDSDFVNLINSNSLEKFNDTTYKKPNELSPQVVQFLFGAKKDSISDVIQASDGYHLIKFLDSREGQTVYTNASQITVNYGTDTNSARAKAEEIIKRLKSGENFEKLVSQFSDDLASKNNNGNMGWFSKGTIDKDLQSAIDDAKINEIAGPVKTSKGFVIFTVHAREKKEFKFADIKKAVKTSTKTIDAIRKRAEDFTYVANKTNFDDEAKKDNLQVLDVPPITQSSFIPGAGQNKSVTKFAFNEKPNSISDPIKIQGGYAVYFLVGKNPAGYQKFEDIKDKALMPLVRTEKKLDMLKQRAADLRNKIAGNNIQSLKASDPGIVIQSVDSFTVSKANPQIGIDYDFDNALFKLSNGQLSDPIRTTKGYYIVQMKTVTPFDETKFNAQSEKIMNDMLAQKKQQVLQQMVEDWKEKAVIVDNRDKYYR
ncbi:MAG: peptidylprolyl isomerase [Ignavibacteria bacterium]